MSSPSGSVPGMEISDRLRIAVVTESFLPTRNGVTTSVCRILEHLSRRGHDTIVICPGPAPETYAGAPVISVPSVPYREFPVGMPSRRVIQALAAFRPDVVHLASPFVVGARGITAAAQLGIPALAAYQTDVPGFATRHHAGVLAAPAWRWIRRLHEQAEVTLAPSTASMISLAGHGVPRLALWPRGVDQTRFTPQRRSSERVQQRRKELAPHGEVLVGYIGRLALEKQVERLKVLVDVPGIRLVVGGDGPARHGLGRTLRQLDPVFLGWLDGDDLADAYALLDIFVHTGTAETFGQTIQEAMATGIPVIAPACGGPLDLIRPGVTGLHYQPDDDNELRDAVTALSYNEAFRRSLGEAGHASVQDRTWQALGDQLITHYRSVIAAFARQAPAACVLPGLPPTRHAMRFMRIR